MIYFLSKADPEELSGVAILRLDFNTEDDWRLEACVPTVKFLSGRARAVIVVSHRGRPEKREMKLSLKKDALRLSKLLKKPVKFLPDFNWKKIKGTIQESHLGSIFVLENIRFLPGEMTESPELAKTLANLADYFVNDAFAVSHRAEDSVSRIEDFLPSYAGLEMESEIEHLSCLLKNSPKPLVVVLGGAKAADKLGVIKYFEKRAGKILLGGASANTMMSLRGLEVGESLVEKDPKVIEHLRKFSKFRNVLTPLDGVKDGNKFLDIGIKTRKIYTNELKKARAIFWSGPLGFTEKNKFAGGTLAVARAIAENRKALKIAGGGETVSFLRKHKLAKKFTFISTGGGALLDYLAGQKLPGISALDRVKNKR